MRERLDVILVNRGHAASREKAKKLIASGLVYVNGQKSGKAGAFFEEAEISLEVRGGGRKYVGRGGFKLEKALEKWEISVEGRVCMDIGASTGGFTDCMLQRGATKVYAVDVGRGQLAEELRADERVVCMEQTNFRYMTRADIREEPDFASVDVSFISLTKMLLPAGRLLKEGGEMVCLVKPQFEAGKGRVGKKGVVRDLRIHREVLGKIVDYAELTGFCVLHLDYSPIRGADGNREYLLHLARRDGPREGLSEGEAEEALAVLLAKGGGLSASGPWRQLIADTVEASRRAEEL